MAKRSEHTQGTGHWEVPENLLDDVAYCLVGAAGSGAEDTAAIVRHDGDAIQEQEKRKKGSTIVASRMDVSAELSRPAEHRAATVRPRAKGTTAVHRSAEK